MVKKDSHACWVVTLALPGAALIMSTTTSMAETAKKNRATKSRNRIKRAES